MAPLSTFSGRRSHRARQLRPVRERSSASEPLRPGDGLHQYELELAGLINAHARVWRCSACSAPVQSVMAAGARAAGKKR
jgi:hypothetical protein